MRAETVLLGALSVLKGVVHQGRIQSVVCSAVALLRGGNATLTGIGRSRGRSTTTKHRIKAVDRLLANVALKSELLLFYAAIASAARSPLRTDRPLLAVDWTDIGPHWACLVVTLISEGRGLVVHSATYPKRKENCPKAEALALRTVAKIPCLRHAIIVSDAGFRVPWMKAVLSIPGWDFVCRVRGRARVQLSGDPTFIPIKSLWERATARATSLGMVRLTFASAFRTRLILFQARRHSTKALPAIGRRKRRNIRSAREPWVLVTSLAASIATPKKVKDLYARRMRIEETFRDQKCPRFGWSLDKARSAKRQRIAVLCLLAALAHYLAMVLGAAAEQAGLHRSLQANTRHARVLSLPRLAREVLLNCSTKELDALLAKLQRPPTASLRWT